MGKRIFLWLYLFFVLLSLYAIAIGIVCFFVNYFFVDIFTIKNYVGIVLVLTIFYFINDFEENKKTIDYIMNKKSR